MRGPGYWTGGAGALIDAPGRAGATLAAAGWTETDPSALKVTSGPGAAMFSGWNGQYINARITNPATVSNLPNLALQWQTPTTTMKGVVRGANILDMLSALFVFTSQADPTSADTWIGAWVQNAGATLGWGVYLLSTGAAGDWRLGTMALSAGVWTKLIGGAAAASSVGNVGHSEPSNGANTKLIRGMPLDSTGTELSTAAGAAPAGIMTLADNLSIFALGCGWETGAGGTPNTDLVIGGAEMIGDPFLATLKGT